MQEQQEPVRNTWLVDNGCSRHMTGERDLLSSFKAGYRGKVSFAGEKGGDISRIGNVHNGKFTLEDVYYVKELEHNLVSVSQVCDRGNTVLFTEKDALVLKPGFKIPEEWIMMRAPRNNDLYEMDMNLIQAAEEPTCLISKASESESLLWHKKMAHLHLRKMNYITKHGLVEGVPLKSFSFEDKCVPCKKGSNTRNRIRPRSRTP